MTNNAPHIPRSGSRTGRAPREEGRLKANGGVLVSVAILLGGCATAPPAVPPPLSVEEKLAAVMQLEQQRVLRPELGTIAERGIPTPEGALAQPMPSLLELLGDGADRIRRSAAIAIGRVGLSEGVMPLIGALDDPSPPVRQMAAFGLGLSSDPRAIDPLIRVLNDDVEPLVRGRAAEALSRLGATTSASEVGDLVADLAQAAAGIEPDDLTYPQPPDIEAFRLGVVALAMLNAYEPLAEAVLGVHGLPRIRWWPVAWALQHLADPRSGAALTSFAQSQGSYTVAYAAQGLGRLGDPTAVDVLLPLLNTRRYDSQVVVAATRALSQLAHPQATSALLELAQLENLDPIVRLEAIAALGVSRATEATDLLLDLLSHPQPAMRAVALESLARLDDQTFILVLSGLDVDPHWSVRAVLARVLGSLHPDLALPRLRVMLDDPDRRVIPAVLSAFTSLRAPEATSAAEDLLGSDDVVVRMAAATQLGILGAPGGVAALTSAYQRSLGDSSPLARLAIVNAIARYGTTIAMGALTHALSDEEWIVRRRVADHLTRLDPSTDYQSRVRLAPGVRGTQALRLVNPEVSPQIFVETDSGTIQIELAVLDAPITSDSFAQLAASGFFDGLAFHEVVPNAVVRGGDPRGDGFGGPGYTVRDEINERPFLRGTVGLARDEPETGGSQFFVTLAPQPSMDGRYTVFGRVVAGMEVIDGLTRWDVIRHTRVWDGVSMIGR